MKYITVKATTQEQISAVQSIHKLFVKTLHLAEDNLAFTKVMVKRLDEGEKSISPNPFLQVRWIDYHKNNIANRKKLAKLTTLTKNLIKYPLFLKQEEFDTLRGILIEAEANLLDDVEKVIDHKAILWEQCDPDNHLTYPAYAELKRHNVMADKYIATLKNVGVLLYLLDNSK